MSLDELKLLNKGIIKNINLAYKEKTRLYDLGFVEENIIIPLFSSPLKNIKAYLVKGMVIALRNDITSNIIVEDKLNV